MKRLIEALSVDVHVLPVTLDGLKVANSLRGWSWPSLDPPPTAGRGFEVTQGLVGWMGGSTRYFLGPNTSGNAGMSWPPVNVRVSITVQHCNHSHNLVLNQKFWSSPVSWRQMTK